MKLDVWILLQSREKIIGCLYRRNHRMRCEDDNDDALEEVLKESKRQAPVDQGHLLVKFASRLIQDRSLSSIQADK